MKWPAPLLVATAIGAVAIGGTAIGVQAADPFAPLLAESRPLQTRWQVDYDSQARIGVGYVSEDNFRFGQYNGLHQQGPVLLGDLQWRGEGIASRWEVRGKDLGLQTREIDLNWARPGKLEFSAGLDSQLQVRNDSAVTPFINGNVLTLPADWVAAANTQGFSSLDSSLRGLERELKRDRYSLGLSAQLGPAWELTANLGYEDKQGTAEVGAAFYVDAAAGHAAVLPQDIDYQSKDIDIALNFSGSDLHLTGSWLYSDFDNSADLLRWQNPYSGFLPEVSYPDGEGGLGQAPDNTVNRLRLLGVYSFSSDWRLQVDASFTRTEQDQTYAQYSVNPDLPAAEPLPQDSYDGRLDSGVLDARLYYQATPKLGFEARFHGKQRDYSGDRNGYRYIRGDAAPQPGAALTVYNTLVDSSSNLVSLQGSYRLPWRSKLWLEYAYEEVDRKNAAVATTQENRLQLRYRIRPVSGLSSTIKAAYADRAADTYQWDQSYYARLDAELINQTPDSQRYSNHPLLSQYHLSNRERTELRWDASWQPSGDWNLTANLSWWQDDYDKTELGLRAAELARLGFNLSWSARAELMLTAYASADRYRAEQRGRSFRGGQEKNAFAVTAPLPQASDPARNWDTDADDEALTVGVNAQWLPLADFSFSADYSFVQTTAALQGAAGFADGIDTTPLPDAGSEQHHLRLEGAWHLRDNLSVQVDYQYWNYQQDDWALAGVTASSLDKVLGLAEQEADESLHYVGTSVIYRWQ